MPSDTDDDEEDIIQEERTSLLSVLESKLKKGEKVNGDLTPNQNQNWDRHLSTGLHHHRHWTKSPTLRRSLFSALESILIHDTDMTFLVSYCYQQTQTDPELFAPQQVPGVVLVHEVQEISVLRRGEISLVDSWIKKTMQGLVSNKDRSSPRR